MLSTQKKWKSFVNKVHLGVLKELRNGSYQNRLTVKKKEDDRVKVLVGACVLEALKNNYLVRLDNPNELLAMLNHFLVREPE